MELFVFDTEVAASLIVLVPTLSVAFQNFPSNSHLQVDIKVFVNYECVYTNICIHTMDAKGD